MTDEKEIAVSVEYAQNTAASLFGDEAVEPTVEAIKEGEPRDESEPCQILWKFPSSPIADQSAAAAIS